MTEVSVSARGTTFLSGGISDLDTQSLIQNAVNAKLLPKKRLLDQVSTNTSKIAAFQKLQTLAEAFKTSLDKLKSDVTNNGIFANNRVTLDRRLAADNRRVNAHIRPNIRPVPNH